VFAFTAECTTIETMQRKVLIDTAINTFNKQTQTAYYTVALKK